MVRAGPGRRFHGRQSPEAWVFTCTDSKNPLLRAFLASSGLRHSSIRNFTKQAGGRRNGSRMMSVARVFATGIHCAAVRDADRLRRILARR